jgi:hypothetical protein
MFSTDMSQSGSYGGKLHGRHEIDQVLGPAVRLKLRQKLQNAN